MDMVKSLGATLMFDHADKYVVDQVVEALRGREFVGALHGNMRPQEYARLRGCLVRLPAGGDSDLLAGIVVERHFDVGIVTGDEPDPQDIRRRSSYAPGQGSGTVGPLNPRHLPRRAGCQ